MSSIAPSSRLWMVAASRKSGSSSCAGASPSATMAAVSRRRRRLCSASSSAFGWSISPTLPFSSSRSHPSLSSASIPSPLNAQCQKRRLSRSTIWATATSSSSSSAAAHSVRYGRIWTVSAPATTTTATANATRRLSSSVLEAVDSEASNNNGNGRNGPTAAPSGAETPPADVSPSEGRQAAATAVAGAEVEAAPSSASAEEVGPTPVAAKISKEDEHREESKRRRLSEVPISEVVKAKHSFRWVDPVIRETATVKEAIVTAIEGGLSGMMVLADDGAGNDDDDDEVDPRTDGDGQRPSPATLSRSGKKKKRNNNRVVGLLTSRDLLRIMAAGIRRGESDADVLNKTVVGDFMTPISQVIYGRPDETVGMCRTIMAKLGIKCLPILDRQGRVDGLVTARDMSDFGLTAADRGGKKSYLSDVSERVGLSSNRTSMAEPPPFHKASLALKETPLYANAAVSALPHPFKTPDGGIGRGPLDMSDGEYSTDPDLSEDAHFVTTVRLPDDQDGGLRRMTYLGVADGVGSWREYGVDPRQFSRRLMEECENVLHEAEAEVVRAESTAALVDGRHSFAAAIAPDEILASAYERCKAAGVVGSTTACVALFDSVRHQLHFSNLGDCGILVLRHIDSDVAGTLKRDRSTPRAERQSDLRLAFVSQQQLLSFNHPFQLGWTGRELTDDDETSSFKTARDACTTSIALRRGDIVVMATDGLFDNVDVDDICALALEWEEQNGFLRGGDTAARERRWSMGNSLSLLSAERVIDLAKRLCLAARENSLDADRDSPFAILAKENDIMWSGGMPDDCTVFVVHVVGRDPKDTMDATQQ